MRIRLSSCPGDGRVNVVVAATIAFRSFFLGFVADGGCCEFFLSTSECACLLPEDVHLGCNPSLPRTAELESEGTKFAGEVGWLAAKDLHH
jgi:hypothetical protein